ncbi:uncharacterized protein F5891DRAFT_157713 [Suillus fuscotomentosus]|uniref:Uncharacterized protein n=1 Tax=Suillus fuscotomentosus TaxID=1912939 RepID=A0AAD4DRF3_9AGAM|nr:uncharacterized protein F5891DRAFT_157713 [Suillus fuscotomentosus]KAG1888996.1 hypothetical protein F5891DRAFT_157713 [Suillus fuscotomentosus]
MNMFLLGSAVPNCRMIHSHPLRFSHTNLSSALTVTRLSFRICPLCLMGIHSNKVLGLHKFAKNIAEPTASDTYLATYDIVRGDTIKKRVLDSNTIFRKNEASDRARQILINVQYDTARMRTVLNKHLKAKIICPIFVAMYMFFLIEGQVE